MAIIAVHLRSALRQLRTYPVESALIVIALAVGVGALSAVAALYGVNDAIARQLRADLSSRQFVIGAASSSSFAELDGERLIAPLRENQATILEFTRQDVAALRELAPGVDHIYLRATYGFRPARALQGGAPPNVNVVTSGFTAAARPQVMRGSWFSRSDFDEARRVIVIIEGHERRFGLEGDPLGQQIDMNLTPMQRSVPYTVIGVLPADHVAPAGGGRLVSGYIPDRSEPMYRHAALYASVDDPRRIPQATEELRRAVDRRWEGAASVRAPASLFQATAAERNRALILAGFASLGLLMASLNIANMLLARVRRREKSIAILRSLGATQANVRAQVFVEAALLGLVGGLVGVALSALFLRWLVATSSPGLAELLATASSPLPTFLATLAVSVLVTVIIGIVPAARAARTAIVPGAASHVEVAPGLPRPVRRNPVRVVLTALQLAISGAAIVVGLHVFAVVNSTKPEQELFYVEALNQDLERVGWLYVFTPDEIDELWALAPAATDVTLWGSEYSPGVVVTPNQEYAISSVTRAGPEYLPMMGAEIVAGVDLSHGSGADDEVLIERGVAEMLYSSADAALGQEFTLRRAWADAGDPVADRRTFTVAGVYSYPETGSVFGAPERVAAVLPPGRMGSFTILASAPAGQGATAKEELISAARIVYGDTHSSPGFGTSGLDFVAQDLLQVSQLKDTLDQTLYLFALLAVTAIILAGVGAFSLSVLNTTERTREIGVRRALGASRVQVAVEVAGSAASLAALAATIGVAVAWLAAPTLTTAVSSSLLSGVAIPTQASLAFATIFGVMVVSAALGWLVGQRATRATPSSVLSEEGV